MKTVNATGKVWPEPTAMVKAEVDRVLYGRLKRHWHERRTNDNDYS